MLWVITDTHIGHKKMVQCCGRPENFSSLICRNWKKCVGDNDTVIHLGDIAWGTENLERLLRLPGHKILVRGNHDKLRTKEYMDKGFELVTDSLTMDFDGMKVLFSHKPMFSHTADINIHGHQHDLHFEDISKLYLPLALEHMGYRPIAINDDFLSTLHRWTGRWKRNGQIPTLMEIIKFREDYIGVPLERDYIGGMRDTSLSPVVFWYFQPMYLEIPQEDLRNVCVNGNLIFIAFNGSIDDYTWLTKTEKFDRVTSIRLKERMLAVEDIKVVFEKKNETLQEDIILCWLKVHEIQLT